MVEHYVPTHGEALANLLDALNEKIERGTDGGHPWIPGANFHDGRLDEAIVAAEVSLGRRRDSLLTRYDKRATLST